jgi:hypothetical protein
LIAGDDSRAALVFDDQELVAGSGQLGTVPQIAFFSTTDSGLRLLL